MSSTTKKTKSSSKTASPPLSGEKSKKPTAITSAPTSPWVEQRSGTTDPALPWAGGERAITHSYRTLSQKKGRLALLPSGILHQWPREFLEFHRHSLLLTPVRVLPRLGLPLLLHCREISRQEPLINSGLFLLTLEGSIPTWRRPCTRFTVGWIRSCTDNMDNLWQPNGHNFSDSVTPLLLLLL